MGLGRAIVEINEFWRAFCPPPAGVGGGRAAALQRVPVNRRCCLASAFYLAFIGLVGPSDFGALHPLPPPAEDIASQTSAL
jgi:hypothetical protein